jgi:hypothetical protein
MDTQTNNQLILSPENIPVLSKTNAATFHAMARQKIFDTGNGLFEYLETINFCAALKDQINGNTQSKIPKDKELIDYVREQIKLMGEKEKFTTARGVKFENAETGTTYDFSNCNDPELVELETKEAEAKENVKQRKEFLKNLSKPMDIRFNDELVTVYPATKTSNSAFKVSLPK